MAAVSSQSCIGYGYVPARVVDSVFDAAARLLLPAGGALDAISYSTGAGSHAVHPSLAPHDDAKPGPAQLLRLAAALRLECRGGYMVGDHLSDLQAGRAAGVTPILVRTGGGRDTEQQLAGQAEWADLVIVDDLPAAARYILKQG